MGLINLDEILSLDKQQNKLPKCKIVLYGAGNVCKDLIKYYRMLNIEVVGIVDTNKEKLGLMIEGVMIIDKNELASYSSSDICIQPSVGEYLYDEVRDSIVENYPEYTVYEYGKNGMYSINRQRYVAFIIKNKEKISNMVYNFSDDESRYKFEMVLKGFVSEDMSYFEKIATEDQYFNDLTKTDEEECFVDAGAYNGDTLNLFNEITEGKFIKAICFEPFNTQFKDLEATAKKISNEVSKIELHELALYSKTSELLLDTSIPGGASSRLNLNGNYGDVIKAVALDDMNIEKVSFIKMDIEGSEFEALKGSKNTILRNSPKLAICTYHNPEDILDIYTWIRELDIPYKIYLRHHCKTSPNQYCETVLYAIV